MGPPVQSIWVEPPALGVTAMRKPGSQLEAGSDPQTLSTYRLLSAASLFCVEGVSRPLAPGKRHRINIPEHSAVCLPRAPQTPKIMKLRILVPECGSTQFHAQIGQWKLPGTAACNRD